MSKSTRITDTPACDGCKVRKVKCSRQKPCRACDQAALECTYNTVPLRRGPRGRKGHLVSLLDSSPAMPDGLCEVETARSVSETDAPMCVQSQMMAWEGRSCKSPEVGKSPPPSSSPSLEPFAKTPGPVANAPSPDERTDHVLEDQKQYHFQPLKRIRSTVIQAHVHVFLKHMFPIMPVLDPDTVLQECTNPEALPAQNYAFLAALCAATHIQLKLSDPDNGESAQHCQPDSTSAIHGESLIEEVLRTRQDFDSLENPSCIVLLTSFFLFAAYGNLNKGISALFYLHQAISLAFTLGLHDEDTYTILPFVEAERQRSIYWLLFITERYVCWSYVATSLPSRLMIFFHRAYCLQVGKPVILSPCIRRPQSTGTENSAVWYGFSNLISLFVKLDSSLYDPRAMKRGYLSSGKPLLEPGLVRTLEDLSTFKPSVVGMLDTHRVDVLLTRDWLQIYLLGTDFLAQGAHECSRIAHSRRGSWSALLSCAKSVMETVSSASHSCISAHGIGMVRHP